MATPAEVAQANQVSQQLAQRLAPAVLANLQTNADQIALYLKKNNLEWNADNVVTAVWRLHEKALILWEVDPIPPPVKSKAQAEAEQGAAMDRKQRENHFASTHQKSHVEAGESGRQQHIVEAEAKELKTIKSQIAREIDGHIVGHHSGGINYTRTNSERGSLRSVLAQHKCDTVEAAKRALSAVRIAKNKLGR